MLLQEFDENKKAILNPEDIHKKTDDFPKTCVSFFSKTLMQEFINVFNAEVIGHVTNSTCKFIIYKINYKGEDIAVYQSPVGAPACVANFEEIIAMGVEKLILVGCCGCLKKDMEDYSIIIPTSALRDEGTSYHYLPESDEIEIDKQCVNIIEAVMKENNINYHKGKTWTTDAIFRETREKANKRISQGAITVEMECSAMASVSKFRNVKFCQFFYASDNLAGESYDPRSLINGDLSKKAYVIPLALECALKLNNL